MIIPITAAYIKTKVEGEDFISKLNIDFKKNEKAWRKQREKTRPQIKAGIVNMKAVVSILRISYYLVRPIILITPISNDLVSTPTVSKE